MEEEEENGEERKDGLWVVEQEGVKMDLGESGKKGGIKAEAAEELNGMRTGKKESGASSGRLRLEV